MATFDFQITDADIGRTLDPPDGFIVNLKRTQAGVREASQFSASKQQWVVGRFVLRGAREFRDLMFFHVKQLGVRTEVFDLSKTRPQPSGHLRCKWVRIIEVLQQKFALGDEGFCVRGHALP